MSEEWVETTDSTVFPSEKVGVKQVGPLQVTVRATHWRNPRTHRAFKAHVVFQIDQQPAFLCVPVDGYSEGQSFCETFLRIAAMPGDTLDADWETVRRGPTETLTLLSHGYRGEVSVEYIASRRTGVEKPRKHIYCSLGKMVAGRYHRMLYHRLEARIPEGRRFIERIISALVKHP